MGWSDFILSSGKLTNNSSYKDVLSHAAVGVISVLFLLLHTSFCIYYFYVSVPVMGVVNLGSSVVYCAILALNRRNLWRLGCALLVVEVAAYCMLSVYFVGWDVGTQGFLPVMMYPSLLLFHVTLNQRIAHVSILSASMVACYLQKLYLAPVYGGMELGVMTIANLVVCMSAALLTIGISYVSETISEKRYQTQIDHLTDEANQDALTGLWNRRYVNNVLKDLFADAQQRKGAYIASLDIDFFKAVNDTYGHSVGDEVLKQLAAIMLDSLRAADIVARWGGEEFVIILRNINSIGAFTALGKLRTQVEQHIFQIEGWDIKVTVTIGFAGCNNAPDYEQCLRYSDAALYHGKRNGRNVVVDYDSLFPPTIS